MAARLLTPRCETAMIEAISVARVCHLACHHPLPRQDPDGHQQKNCDRKEITNQHAALAGQPSMMRSIRLDCLAMMDSISRGVIVSPPFHFRKRTRLRLSACFFVISSSILRISARRASDRA